VEGITMTRENVMTVETAWKTVSKFLFVPQNEAQYDELVAVLDELIDNIGSDETHPLASLMDVIGAVIEQYENEHVPEITDLEIPSTVEITQRNSSSEE
jgi:HTH-type transcriptional regulator/antitoxin HigA